ncbi:hypothetical protein L9F63_015376 [Diploptera punctata]|uniref:Uncharacterized protein n=1 Tax=Diploptera punctata TaxID=6984 RepID=A0AAD8A727_DIPPU|nr:hypothetical protein L9F63_015376 [Diploptera punctata]
MFKYWTKLLLVMAVFHIFLEVRSHRVKRTMIFVKGSKFFVRLNFKNQVFPNSVLLVYAAGYKLNFNLPDDVKTSPSHFHRRAIYENIESILDQNGINGRECILRFLCEAAQHMMPKNDLLKKIITIIFTVPAGKEHTVLPYYRNEDCRRSRRRMSNIFLSSDISTTSP